MGKIKKSKQTANNKTVQNAYATIKQKQKQKQKLKKKQGQKKWKLPSFPALSWETQLEVYSTFQDLLSSQCKASSKTNALQKNKFTLVYDQHLMELNQIGAAEYRDRMTDFHLGLKAGENLKDFEHFQSWSTSLSKLCLQAPTIWVLGGGSLSDAVGFFASIFHRGIPLVLLPTTWLSAIDSSIGGKTALNVGGLKNQFGTFYPAQKVILIRELLESQPRVNSEDARGEWVKMALLTSPQKKWVKSLIDNPIDPDEIWQLIPSLIKEKMHWVLRDPYEKKGIRTVLNLGHTLGHVIEAKRKVAHGRAVGWGIRFAVEWSRHRGYLSEKDYDKIDRFIDFYLPDAKLYKAGTSTHADRFGDKPSHHKMYNVFSQYKLKPLTRDEILQALSSDKKKAPLKSKAPNGAKQLIDSGSQLRFVFLKKWGVPFTQEVTCEEICDFAKKEGWMG